MKAKQFKIKQEALGLSSKEMADLLGVSLRCVEYWRQGGRAIPKMVEQFFKVLDASRA